MASRTVSTSVTATIPQQFFGDILRNLPSVIKMTQAAMKGYAEHSPDDPIEKDRVLTHMMGHIKEMARMGAALEKGLAFTWNYQFDYPMAAAKLEAVAEVLAKDLRAEGVDVDTLANKIAQYHKEHGAKDTLQHFKDSEAVAETVEESEKEHPIIVPHGTILH